LLLVPGFVIAVVSGAKLGIVLMGAGSSTVALLLLIAFFVERRERRSEPEATQTFPHP
jgi:hypothetical protein